MKRSVKQIKTMLHQHANHQRAVNFRRFFKNSKDDIFLGVPTATIRKLAKEFYLLSLDEIVLLMQSEVHDERSIANAMLCLKFRKSDAANQKIIFNFYIKNRKYINDWDGVDDSAPYIAGPYLLERDKKILYKLVKSKRIWDRRIAIVTTLHFTRQGKINDSLKIAKLLLNDEEDLIHKACGWVLREVGKKDLNALKKFLNKHQSSMPRTMLRYAIERFPEKERKKYLIKTPARS